MDTGFSRELFFQMANHPKNSIILTSRSMPKTLARKLIDNKDMTSITLERRKRVPLQGAELDDYERKQAQLKREQETLKKVNKITIEKYETYKLLILKSQHNNI